MEIEQFSKEAIKAGKLFERLSDEQKAVIWALLHALEDNPNNRNESTAIREDTI